MVKEVGTRGSMSLSMSAIVTVVLAFVMLGLGLTITNMIFGATTSQIPNAISAIDLGTQPTPDNPITVNTLNVKASGSLTEKIGFYNTKPNSVSSAVPVIQRCITNDGTLINSSSVPQIVALPQTVEASKTGAYEMIVTMPSVSSQFAGGKEYVCTMLIVNSNMMTGGRLITTAVDANSDIIDAQKTNVYSSKQFILAVSS